MADGNVKLVIEDGEREYIMPPHPEAHSPVCEETVKTDKPTEAEEPLSVLVEKAVAAQLQNQVRELRSELLEELHTEVQAEIQKEIGGLVLDDNTKKLQPN